MSIEQLLIANTAAIEANTKALLALARAGFNPANLAADTADSNESADESKAADERKAAAAEKKAAEKKAAAAEKRAAEKKAAEALAAAPVGGTEEVAEKAPQVDTDAIAQSLDIAVSRQEMVAALNEVKEEFGAVVAKGIIKTVGGVDKMADIPEDKIGDVYNAAKAKIDGEDEAGL